MCKIPYFGDGEMKMTILLFQARPFETAQIWPEETKEAGIEEATRTTTRKSWRTRSEAGRVQGCEAVCESGPFEGEQ